MCEWASRADGLYTHNPDVISLQHGLSIIYGTVTTFSPPIALRLFNIIWTAGAYSKLCMQEGKPRRA